MNIVLIIVGLLVVALGLIVVSRINSGIPERNRCPHCRGVLIQAYIVNDDRKDLVLCDDCDSLFRQFKGGKLFEVFGIQTLKGGNHDNRTVN